LRRVFCACPDNPLLKLTVQVPDNSIELGLFAFGLAILDLNRNVKLKKRDHRRRMQVHRPGKKQKILTIENEVTLLKQLVAILIVPVFLVFFFWAIFIVENEGGDLSSDFLNVLERDKKN
jgi:hypothetical protein